MLLRKFGQEVIRLTAGKRVHGTGSVPGGVNRHLTRPERDELAAQVPQMLDWCEQAVELVARAAQPRTQALYGRIRQHPFGLDVHRALRWRHGACTTARCVCATPKAASCTTASMCRTTWT
ncbi:MAG: hypothetical protein V9G23_02650 [Giesbergeria sp.]